jgi:hypothetical protein
MRAGHDQWGVFMICASTAMRPGQNAAEDNLAGFGTYVTLNWESPEVERIRFSVMATGLTSFPTRPDPGIERFVWDAAS